MWFSMYVEKIFKTIINCRGQGTQMEVKFLHLAQTGKLTAVECDKYI